MVQQPTTRPSDPRPAEPAAQRGTRAGPQCGGLPASGGRGCLRWSAPVTAILFSDAIRRPRSEPERKAPAGLSSDVKGGDGAGPGC